MMELPSCCCIGVQAIIGQNTGEHVIHVHCYARNLNLVTPDSVSIAIDAANLFQRLKSIYIL